MKFTVSGKLMMGEEERTFRKEIEAPNESSAKERAYAVLGSQNGIVRSKITIEKVEKA